MEEAAAAAADGAKSSISLADSIAQNRRNIIQSGGDSSLTWLCATVTPIGPLAPYVRRIQGYDERTNHPLHRAELPGPTVTVILETGPPLRVRPQPGGVLTSHRGGFVAGLHRVATDTEHDGWQQGIQIDLTVLGARRLWSGLPMSSLAGRVVSVSDLLDKTDRGLVEHLAEERSWELRLAHVQSWLSIRIGSGPPPDPRVVWALHRIDQSGGHTEIHPLPRILGISRKHLATLFGLHVGVPPKVYARLVRFDRLLTQIRAQPMISWSMIAAELGYCDQSHLIRDVRGLTGLTPKELRIRHGPTIEPRLHLSNP